MSNIRTLVSALAVALVMGFGVHADEPEGTTAPADEQEKELVRGPDCLDLVRIQRTEIVDDRTILFHMRGRQTYVSHLPHRCHGLRFERGFVYSTSIPRICGNVDFITVIRRGNSCALGPFYVYEPDTEEPEGQQAGS